MCQIYRSHKIKLKPTKEQETLFSKGCGVSRHAYNWALATWKAQYEAGEKPNWMAIRNLYNSIKSIEFPWCMEVSSLIPNFAIKDLGIAYKNYFAKLKKGEDATKNHPKFKKRGERDSFIALANQDKDDHFAHRIVGKVADLPRIGKVKMRESVRFSGKIVLATISREADGWYIAFQIKTEELLSRVDDRGSVGVDLGLKTLATLSNGITFDNPKHYRSHEKRLAHLQRAVSRKQKGSNNRKKAVLRLARMHKRVADMRKDCLHKLTTNLATNYNVVAIENLNVSGMVKNRKLAKSIADAGFHMFRSMLEYKSSMTETVVKVVDRFYPSSKTCSGCGEIHEMPLKVRVMSCGCGLNIDRDLNAAINLERWVA